MTVILLHHKGFQVALHTRELIGADKSPHARFIPTNCRKRALSKGLKNCNLQLFDVATAFGPYDSLGKAPQIFDEIDFAVKLGKEDNLKPQLLTRLLKGNFCSRKSG